MKKLIIITALAVSAVSCKKEIPALPSQVVTYSVECKSCLVYVEDNYWNRDNKLDRAKNQHFAVSGKWSYSFTNTKLDSVSLRVAVSALSPVQRVKASIKTNTNQYAGFDQDLGSGGEFEKEIAVDLRPVKIIVK